jgi:hypothetical protein
MRLNDSRLATTLRPPPRPSETPTIGLGPEFAGVRWYTRSQQPGAVQRALSRHRTGTAGEVDRATATGQRLRERTECQSSIKAEDTMDNARDLIALSSAMWRQGMTPNSKGQLAGGPSLS